MLKKIFTIFFLVTLFSCGGSQSQQGTPRQSSGQADSSGVILSETKDPIDTDEEQADSSGVILNEVKNPTDADDEQAAGSGEQGAGSSGVILSALPAGRQEAKNPISTNSDPQIFFHVFSYNSPYRSLISGTLSSLYKAANYTGFDVTLSALPAGRQEAKELFNTTALTGFFGSSSSDSKLPQNDSTEISKFSLEADYAITRLDAAVDHTRERTLVVFEKQNTIWGRFYNKNGEIEGEDKVISVPPEPGRHDVDPKFNQIPGFENLTEPKCTSYHNPTVVYLGGTQLEDRYLVAYEASCEALVRWPKDEQFFNNPGLNGNLLFNVAPDKTVPKTQTFSIIQAVKLNAATLEKLAQNENPGPFFTNRAMGRIFAAFLFNNQGPNGEPLRNDQSVWKWASSSNPNLAVDQQGRTLLTYQTNLKYFSCVSNKMELGAEDQWRRYDRVYSVDGQMIFKDRRSPAFSVYRDGITVADSENRGFTAEECAKVENAGEILSSFNPSSAAGDSGAFDAVFSLEKGGLAKHYEQREDLPKTVNGNLIELDEADNVVMPDVTATMFEYAINSDLSGVVSFPWEALKHSDTDISFDHHNNYFLTTFDDGSGVHILLVDKDGLLVDPTNPAKMVKGSNWKDPVVANASTPSLSGAFYKEGDVVDATKIGVTFYHKPADKIIVSQNYALISKNGAGVPILGLERAESYNLSNEIDEVDLDASFVPVATVLGSGPFKNRFQTFWTGIPVRDNGDSIYNVFVSEGSRPVPIIKVAQNGNPLNVADGLVDVRVNDVSEENPLVFRFSGDQSFDPDNPGDPNAVARYEWIIRGNNFGPFALESAALTDNQAHPITTLGDYVITLKVTDRDGFVAEGSITIHLIQNAPPEVTEFKMFVHEDGGDIELAGENLSVRFGKTVILNAVGRDDNTPPENLRFVWDITDPDGARINPEELAPTGSRVRFTLPPSPPRVREDGVYQYTISVKAVDAENAESLGRQRTFIAQSVRINSFISSAAGPIDIAPAVVSGNPAPDEVYGEVSLKWEALDAQFVRLLRKEWRSNGQDGNVEELVPAADLPEHGVSQEERQLPHTFAPDDSGVKVRVHKKTTFIIEARAAAEGGDEIARRELTVSFRGSAASITTPAAISYSNADNNGTVNITWRTTNVGEVHIEAYQWADWSTPPNLQGAGRSLDPAGGWLRLIQQVPLIDRIAKKTTYVLRAKDLFGSDVAPASAVTAFEDAVIVSFAADSNRLDFMPGTSTGQTVVRWQTRNAAAIAALMANGAAVQYRDVANPDAALDVFPAPDPEGRGAGAVRQQSETNYMLRVRNPDGKEVVSNPVQVLFNLPTIEFTLPAEPLYLGRDASVSWTAQNTMELTLVLIDDAGREVAGALQLHRQGLDEINVVPWLFNIPNAQNPPAGGLIYRIRADLRNPNDGGIVEVRSDSFVVQRRPSPTIAEFSVSPAEIEELLNEGGTIIGRAVLQWRAQGVDEARPIVAIMEQRRGAQQWASLPIDFDSLPAADSQDVSIGANDAPTSYQISVRNRFGDIVTSGGNPMYVDEPPPPQSPVLNFRLPRVLDWYVVEQEVYSRRAIHASWETKTATEVRVVFINAGREEVIYTENNFAGVLSTHEIAIDMPQFAEDGVGQIRLDLTGPGGEISSDARNIRLRVIPLAGVMTFCARRAAVGGECLENPNLDFDDGVFSAGTEFMWTVDTRAVERVVRLCIGDAPGEDGSCDGRAVELPEGPNFVPQGVNTGVGSVTLPLKVEGTYWLVTKPLDQQILVYHRMPVNIGFNAPRIGGFTSDRAVINQNMETPVRWNGITNASRITVEAIAGNQIAGIPFSATEDAAFMPAGTVSVMTPNPDAIALRLTAEGPGGSVSNDVQIAVNDLPRVAPVVTLPAVNLELYAPTRLYIKWRASERALDDDQGIVTDRDGMGAYAICYHIYRTNAAGAVLDPGGNKENDRLQDVGVVCPDLSVPYASQDDLPGGTIIVNTTASADCAAEGSNCSVTNGVKEYHRVLDMDPKLNNQTYLRYEIKIMAVDTGASGILGITPVATARTYITDDSVEAWWKFEEDFTAPGAPDCSGAPAGYKICDSSRHAHHARAVGNPQWRGVAQSSFNTGSVVLNPNNEGTQWLEVLSPLSQYSQLSTENNVIPYVVNNHVLIGIGAPGNGRPFGDYFVVLFLNPRVELWMGTDNGSNFSDIIGRTSLIAQVRRHVVTTSASDGRGRIYLDSVLDRDSVPLANLVLPQNRRNVLLGKSGEVYPAFSGEFGETIVYTRELTAREILNNYNAAQ